MSDEEELSEYWWLSFVDPRKPKGTQFLGVCIVGPAPNGAAAHMLSWLYNCNPGGEMAAFQIPKKHLHEVHLDKFNRLLSREECASMGAAPLSTWKNQDRSLS